MTRSLARNPLSLCILLFVLVMSQVALADWWSDRKRDLQRERDNFNDAVNNPARTAKDLAGRLSEATPDGIADSLKAVTDPQRFVDTVKELAKLKPETLGESLNKLDVTRVTNALKSIDQVGDVVKKIDSNKLGPALDELDAAKVSKALDAVSDRIGEVAPHIRSETLGNALNELTPDNIAKGLGAVGNRLGDVAKHIGSGDLGKALNKLGPDQIARGLDAVGGQIGEVAKQIGSEKLGKALDKLSPGKIADGLAAIPDKIGTVAQHIGSEKLGKALNELTPENAAKGIAAASDRIAQVVPHIGSQNLGKALNKLTPENAARGLAAAGDRIAQVVPHIGNQNLGKALNRLTPDNIAKGLDAVGDRIGEVAKEVGSENLGEALDQLTYDKIAKGLEAVGDRITETAKHIGNEKLGKALNELAPTAISKGLQDIGDRIGEVATHISDSNLGDAIELLQVPRIAEALNALPVSRLQAIVDKLNVDNISGAINQLIDAPQRALDVLVAAQERVSDIISDVAPETLNRILKDIKDASQLGNVLGALDEVQLNKLPWEQIDQIKMPWKSLDPRNVPWERVDPSRVKWSELDPSRATDEAGQWFDDRVSAAQSATNEIGDFAKSEFENAIDGGQLAVDQIGGTVADAKAHVQSKFEEGREFMEAQAHKLEQSVRTEVGRAVRYVKETPWYQTIQNFLTRFTHVTAYELDSDLTLTFNASTGSYHVDMAFIPGVTVTNQDLQTLMAGAIPMPNVDVVEVAAASANGVKLVQTSNDYEKIRTAVYRDHGKANVYFASKRFVDWASAETIANEGFKIIVTAGYGTEDALMEAEHQLMTELDEVYAWLQQRLEGEQQSQLRSILKTLMKCIITGKQPNDLGLSLPKLTIQGREVAYKYELQTAGITKLYEDIVEAVADALGIDWEKYRAALQEKLDQLKLNSPHGGFSIVWQSTIDEDEFLEQALADLEQGRISPESLNEQFDLLSEILKELVSNDNVPADLRDNLGKLLDYMDYAKFAQNSAQAQLQNRLASALGFNPSEIELRYKEDTPVLDLMSTPLRGKLEGFLDRLTLGNEGAAEMKMLEFNLATMSFHADATIAHKHVWKLDGLDTALSTAWNKAKESVGEWTGSARRQLSAKTRQSLNDIGALDEQVREAPKRLSDLAQQKLDDAEQEALQAIEDGAEAVRDVRDRLLDTAELLTNPREFLLWHFLEKPRFLEFDEGESGTVYTGEPVYYVNGVFNSLSDAEESCVEVADQLKRPVRLLYNPSFINGETHPEDDNVIPGSTGTPGVGDDLAESVYDRAWITLITAYMNVNPQENLAETLFQNKSSVRLQKNRTTRQIAHLIYYSDSPISIVSHSQGCIQVRNACYTAALLGRESKTVKNIAWVACGSPLGESEVWPKPRRYRSLINGNDFIAKLVGFKGGEDGKIFPLTDHLMTNYVRYLANDDLYGGTNLVARSEVTSPFVFTSESDGGVASEPPSESTSYTLDNASDEITTRLQRYLISEDFDGNGYSDVCLVNEQFNDGELAARRAEIQLNLAGGFTGERIVLRDLFGQQSGRIIAGDFDGDGYADLALVRQPKKTDSDTREAGALLCLRNDRNQGFQDLFFIGGPVDSESLLWDSKAVFAGDFNGDGLCDLLDYDRHNQSYRVQLNAGQNEFGEPTEEFVLDTGLESDGLVPMIGDYNADGRDDLLLASERIVSQQIRRFVRKHFRTRVCCCTVRYRVPENLVFFAKALTIGFEKRGEVEFADLSERVDLVGDWNGDGFADLSAMSTPSADNSVLTWALNISAPAEGAESQLRFGPTRTGTLDLAFEFEAFAGRTAASIKSDLPEASTTLSSMRSWTDTSNTKTVRAKYLYRQAGRAVFMREDGRIVSARPSSLSLSDQRFLADLSAKEKTLEVAHAE